jgi:anti-sigma B factor antagonist
MSLVWNARHIDHMVILDLSGRITLGEALILREEIRDLLANDQKNILLNLADVSYIDSAGLGELVGMLVSVSKRGGGLRLLNLQSRVQELMQITKLYSVFETFADENTALRSVRGT